MSCHWETKIFQYHWPLNLWSHLMARFLVITKIFIFLIFKICRFSSSLMIILIMEYFNWFCKDRSYTYFALTKILEQEVYCGGAKHSSIILWTKIGQIVTHDKNDNIVQFVITGWVKYFLVMKYFSIVLIFTCCNRWVINHKLTCVVSGRVRCVNGQKFPQQSWF